MRASRRERRTGASLLRWLETTGPLIILAAVLLLLDAPGAEPPPARTTSPAKFTREIGARVTVVQDDPSPAPARLALPDAEIAGWSADEGWPLAGLVVDDTDTPLAGAALLLDDRVAASTDAQGRFQLHDPTPTPRSAGRIFEVRAEGRAARRIQLIHGVRQEGYADGEPLHIVLPRLGSLWGRVRGPDGGPLAEATIYGYVSRALCTSPCQIVHDETSQLSVSTDASGVFRIAAATPGDWHLRATTDGLTGRETVLTLPPACDVDAGSFELGVPAYLVGQVVDAAGTPQVGAIVAARRIGDPPHRDDEDRPGEFTPYVPEVEHVETDEWGRFDLGPVVPGGWQLGARNDHGAGALQAATCVETKSGRVEEIRIVFPSVPRHLRGTVVDERGWPVAGARVSVVELGLFPSRDRGIVTDAAGAFEADVAPGLDISVVAFLDDKNLRAVAIVAATEASEVHLVAEPFHSFCSTNH